MSRRLLQVVNAVLAVMTIALAAASFVFGVDSPIASRDTHGVAAFWS